VLKNSVGFVLLNIENNDYYDSLLKEISRLIIHNPLTNIVVFNSHCDKVSLYNVPLLHINHAKFFNGDLWLFDIIGLIISKNFTNINKKILYVNDMPWIKNRDNMYSEWKSLYNKDINFVASNKYLYDVYSLCWSQPLEIMESFNHEKIQHILQ